MASWPRSKIEPAVTAIGAFGSRGCVLSTAVRKPPMQEERNQQFLARRRARQEKYMQWQELWTPSGHLLLNLHWLLSDSLRFHHGAELDTKRLNGRRERR